MNLSGRYLIGMYYGISILLLIFGYLYEAPFSSRKSMLLILSVFYLVLVIIQNIVRRRKGQYIVITIVAFTLIAIEMHSKYAINYFYHSIYIILLMYILFKYSKKEGLLLSIILIMSSIVKFVELIFIQPSQGNIAIFLFFFIIQLLVLLAGFFAKVYRDENAKTNDLYHELLETNKQLRQLTKMEERTNIARDLHDTLGHDMTGLIMQMEMISRLFKANNTDKGILLLDEAKKSARDSLGKVRQIVNTLKNDNNIDWTNSSLKSLTDDFAKKTATTIECNINGEKIVNPDVGITLYRSIQEALTNAVRHGKATVVKVKVEYLEQEIIFTIEDNGVGCKNIKKGNGLAGMLERIALLQGEIEFENTSSGFKVKGSIPYGQEDKHDKNNVSR